MIDELHVAVCPILLRRGEALLEGLDLLALGNRPLAATQPRLTPQVALAAMQVGQRAPTGKLKNWRSPLAGL